ncbi:MAG: oligosaccharide flippase family protein [Chitinophagales bacterium]|nr:oligosaccharide flippase family protein [Chitinophagales bacterium]MCZ2392807.1 oligosaccharide flippase family protein [Chitinophagales bacterium]
MRQSFLFNTFFALLVNFIIKPIWIFGIDRTVQNELGSHEYGLYFAVFNFTYLFQIFLDFGLQNYTQTEISLDNSQFGKLFPALLSSKLLMTVIYLLLSITAAAALGYIQYDFFPWLVLNQILLSFNIFLRANINAHKLFIKDAILSSLDKFLMIIGCSIMILPHPKMIELNISNFVWIQTISLTVTTFVCIYFSLQLSTQFYWRFDKKLFKRIIVSTIPFAIIYFLMTVYYRIDTVMIEKMLGTKGAYEAGIYAQSYRIMESVNNIGYIIAGILLPIFANKISQIDQVRKIILQGFNIMLVIIVPIVLGGAFYSKEIISTLYKDAPQYSSSIFTILLFNFVPVGLLYVFGPLLTVKKSFRIMIPSLFIASLLNIGLNYILIPQNGALGAAYATFATQILMLIIYSIAIVALFKIHLNFSLIFRVLLFIITVYAINKLIYQTEILWIFALFISGMLSLISALLFKIITKDTLFLKIN